MSEKDKTHWLKWGVPILAAVAYGSWAAFANSEYGSVVAVKAGVGQGGYAFVSTWLVTAVALAALNLTSNPWASRCVSFCLSFVIMLAMPLTIHFFIDTPNVWQAILPGLIWGSGYIGWLIWQQSSQSVAITTN